jgi:hypothetical protein
MGHGQVSYRSRTRGHALRFDLMVSGARADGGQIAAGVAGGLIGGTLLGAAIASRPAPPPPVYYAAPPPPPVYVEEPACRYVGERFWDGYGWRYRRMEVCN